MALHNARRVQTEMAEALSCPICFCRYDLERHLPKVFPCQHTVCLECVEQLYEALDAVLVGNALHCPTCRHLVTVPLAGPTGLTTNFAVRNMVEILAKDTTETMCRKHKTFFITNVCMKCEVGICPNCISSDGFHDHYHHRSEVLELEAAFEVLKAKGDVLEQEAQRVKALLSERGNMIDNLIKPIRGDCVSKNLGIFQSLKTLESVLRSSEFIDSSSGMKSGGGELAVSMQVDLLRLHLRKEDDKLVAATLTNVWHLLEVSEPCCHSLIALKGIDLLVSCFSLCQREQTLLRPLLEVLGSLAEHQIFHNHIVTTPIVSQLVGVLQKKFTMKDEQAPERACRVLAHILSNDSVTWPLGCVSREDTSRLVIEACKQFAPLQTFTKTSFRHELLLMSQQTSQAAKYWAIWWLHQCMLKHPTRYAPILVKERALTVLENQYCSDSYLRLQCTTITTNIYYFKHKDDITRKIDALENNSDITRNRNAHGIKSGTNSAVCTLL